MGAKTLKLSSQIIQNFKSHYPPSENVQVILLKLKMATTTFKIVVIATTPAYFMVGDDIIFEILCNSLYVVTYTFHQFKVGHSLGDRGILWEISYMTYKSEI